MESEYMSERDYHRQSKNFLFDAISKDGNSISNGVVLRKVQEGLNRAVSKEMYFKIRNELIAEGQLGKGVGYGGSVCRIK